MYQSESGPLSRAPARGLLGLQGGSAALQIGREVAGVALPHHGSAPVIAGGLAAAVRRAASAFELVVWRAVAHRVVDGHLIAGMNGVPGDDGDLPVEAGIRLASVVDEVRRFVGRERGKIKPLLHLHSVAANVLRQDVKLVGRDQASAPHGHDFARQDQLPSEYGLATGHVTISDFALFGEVSRRSLAHETSAMARRAVRFAVYSWRCRPLPVRHPRVRIPNAGASV